MNLFLRAILVLKFGLLLASPSTTCGDEGESPRGLGFNLGVYTKMAIDDIQSRNVGDRVEKAGSSFTIRYLRIVTMEGSKEATRDQKTLFFFCGSTFVSSLPGPYMLDAVEAEFIILDANGKPTEAQSRRIEYQAVYVDNKWSWKRENRSGRSLKEWHSALPKWAQEQLWLVTGFLAKNPGQQVVSFDKTDAEFIVAALGLLADLAPSVAKKAVGEIIENVLRQAGINGLERLAESDKLRSGSADKVENKKALEFTPNFIRDGDELWSRWVH